MKLRNILATIQSRAGAIGEADMAAFRVVIVDCNADIREGLRAILDSRDDIDVVAAVATVDQAAGDLQGTMPDVVLVDAQVPDGDGVSETHRVTQRWPMTKVIALAVHSSVTNAALAAGADRVVMKDAGRQVLLDAVRSATRPSSRGRRTSTRQQ